MEVAPAGNSSSSYLVYILYALVPVMCFVVYKLFKYTRESKIQKALRKETRERLNDNYIKI